MRQLLILAVLLCGADFAEAGPTQRACLSVDRSPGPRACSCAQDVAERTLSRRDQELAARIIRDPDLFKKYTDNKGRRAQSFVERYRRWGARVEAECAGA